MQRRSVLKNLAMTVGVLVSLPAWASGWTLDSIGPVSIVSLNDETLLGEMAASPNPAGKPFVDMIKRLTIQGYTNAEYYLTHDSPNKAPGLDIHEMGGVRMGRDPKTSMLNKRNQLHACKNVFVTDGACMTSTSTQN